MCPFFLFERIDLLVDLSKVNEVAVLFSARNTQIN